MVSNAQNLFKDGIQIVDCGKIIFDVVDRLRAKFMELDSIGSILAGGVLMGALTKIGSKLRSLVTGFRELRMGSFGTSSGTSATSKGGVSASQSVGTMTVNASVVNVNGSRKVGNQSIIENYNRTKETIRNVLSDTSPFASRFAGAKSAVAAAVLPKLKAVSFRRKLISTRANTAQKLLFRCQVRIATALWTSTKKPARFSAANR